MEAQKKKAEEEVAAWKHPIGTQVVVTRDNGEEVRTKTRSEPWVLGGHSAVIMVEGISGGYSLERVRLGPVSGDARDPMKWQHLQPFVDHMQARLDAKVAERGPGETWMQAGGVELIHQAGRKLDKAFDFVSHGADEAVVGAALADAANYVAMAYQRLSCKMATPRVPGAGGRTDP
ncbi:hypothetical protein [Myxococcus eversor]|uniref:hypothetical protein n=1 Tax=Myxococcus eversor TaxID=2709661 RepID=UPI0019675BEE|nr:hypothetical protein [Myxococcus eversor]